VWDLLGMKPVFPALAARFLSTAPPGKSSLSGNREKPIYSKED